MFAAKWARTLTLSLSLAALGLGASAQTALAPGGSVSVPLAGLAGTLLASKTTTFSSPDYSGSVISAVVRDGTTGKLDFLFQVFNDSTSSATDPLARVTLSDFTGFTTSVSYSTSASSLFSSGGVIPTTADRNVSGKVVGFNFPGSGLGSLTPGSYSAILQIFTDADSYTDGTVSVIDGQVASTDGYAPTAVPEPAFYQMAGLLGLGGLSALRLLRKRTA